MGRVSATEPSSTSLAYLPTSLVRASGHSHAKDMPKNSVGGISDMIHILALVSVDFDDLKTGIASGLSSTGGLKVEAPR